MSEDALTVDEMMEFVAGEVKREEDDVDGDVPNHAAKMIASRATDLLQTLTNIEMAEIREGVEDPSEEDVRSAVEEDAVDILLSIGALQHEYDLDLASAFADRMDFIEDYKAFEDAVDDAETQEEVMEAFDEYTPEDADPPMGMGGAGGVEVGQNVDADDYDADDDRDRHIA